MTTRSPAVEIRANVRGPHHIPILIGRAGLTVDAKEQVGGGLVSERKGVVFQFLHPSRALLAQALSHRIDRRQTPF